MSNRWDSVRSTQFDSRIVDLFDANVDRGVARPMLHTLVFTLNSVTIGSYHAWANTGDLLDVDDFGKGDGFINSLTTVAVYTPYKTRVCREFTTILWNVVPGSLTGPKWFNGRIIATSAFSDISFYDTHAALGNGTAGSTYLNTTGGDNNNLTSTWSVVDKDLVYFITFRAAVAASGYYQYRGLTLTTSLAIKSAMAIFALDADTWIDTLTTSGADSLYSCVVLRGFFRAIRQ